MKFKNLALLPGLFLLFACGGSSSDTTANSANPSESTPILSGAVAMAVAVSDAGGDAGHMLTIVDVTTMPSVKSAIQMIDNNGLKWTLTDHEMTEVNGTGTFVVNGTTSLAGAASVYNTKASGDLNVQLKDITKSAGVDGTIYAVTINGELKVSFSGTEMPDDVKTSQIYSDITYTITGSDLAITGTTTGTITDLNAVREMKIMMVDGVAQRVSTCSGTATMKTDSGTATCTYQSDCSKCS